MRICELIKLEQGTPIYGISYSGIENFHSEDPSDFRVLVLDTQAWNSNIRSPVRYTYFPDSVLSEQYNVTLHSKTIVPYYEPKNIRSNHLKILESLGYRDKEGFFQPSEFVGVLLGETIVGSSTSQTTIDVEVFTRILLSDRIVWLRLWNYLPANHARLLKVNSLEDVPLKIRP